jgi:hypothetical protein
MLKEVGWDNHGFWGARNIQLLLRLSTNLNKYIIKVLPYTILLKYKQYHLQGFEP